MISSVMPATLMSICSEVMPSRRAGDLEVHVAEVVLVAEDVAEDREVLAFEDQAHGDAGDRALQGNAGVHHREAPPQTVAIDDEPLLSVMSERTRMV